MSNAHPKPGEYLQAARSFRRLSQRDLAELSGVCRVAISRTEQGKTRPQSATTRALGRALGFKPEHLFPPTGRHSKSAELRILLDIKTKEKQ